MKKVIKNKNLKSSHANKNLHSLISFKKNFLPKHKNFKNKKDLPKQVLKFILL